ncbi:TerC family protein [Herminiimonas fonticola]|uniref:TerC family protein n=1 Tax=Herminiimonas fonticola TaxID=303380 RepID=UPI0033417970
MDMFSAEFLSALMAIIVIDLVLAGDNAIVIALVARKLPQHLQRITIIGGTLGAVAVRVTMTLAIVWLLNVPGLLLVGGLLLVWIAYKLLAPVQEEKKGVHLSASQVGLWAAIRTIIVADAVMGLDNVLGVAGAAQGEFMLVVVGLLISIPIMVVGSTLILKWVERYPVIIYVGAAVLAWTAAKMIVQEPMMSEFFGQNPFLLWLLYGLVIGGVVLSGLLRNAPWKPTQREGTPRHS